MSIALHIFGWGFLALAVLGFFAFKAADRPGDDFGSGILAWLLIALAVLFFIVWVLLAIIKAASA